MSISAVTGTAGTGATGDGGRPKIRSEVWLPPGDEL